MRQLRFVPTAAESGTLTAVISRKYQPRAQDAHVPYIEKPQIRLLYGLKYAPPETELSLFKFGFQERNINY